MNHMLIPIYLQQPNNILVRPWSHILLTTKFGKYNQGARGTNPIYLDLLVTWWQTVSFYEFQGISSTTRRLTGTKFWAKSQDKPHILRQSPQINIYSLVCDVSTAIKRIVMQFEMDISHFYTALSRQLLSAFSPPCRLYKGIQAASWEERETLKKSTEFWQNRHVLAGSVEIKKDGELVSLKCKAEVASLCRNGLQTVPSGWIITTLVIPCFDKWHLNQVNNFPTVWFEKSDKTNGNPVSFRCALCSVLMSNY